MSELLPERGEIEEGGAILEGAQGLCERTDDAAAPHLAAAPKPRELFRSIPFPFVRAGARPDVASGRAPA